MKFIFAFLALTAYNVVFDAILNRPTELTASWEGGMVCGLFTIWFISRIIPEKEPFHK